MTPHAFVAKWSQIQLKEITIAQSHFLNVCQLVSHAAPRDADPAGNFFTFEAATDKIGGKQGRGDVWYKNKFIWEYKGAHHDLDKTQELDAAVLAAYGWPSSLSDEQILERLPALNLERAARQENQ